MNAAGEGDAVDVAHTSAGQCGLAMSQVRAQRSAHHVVIEFRDRDAAGLSHTAA